MGYQTSEMKENQGSDFTEKEDTDRRRVKMQGGENWRGIRGTRAGRNNNEGTDRPERDNQLSSGCSRSQTDSPDDTSVCLTHTDSIIALFKTCRQHRGQRQHTHTVGLHDDDSGQFQAFIKYQIMT